MISWRWRGHVYDAAYAIVYIIAIIGFTLIFIIFLYLIYGTYTPPPHMPSSYYFIVYLYQHLVVF